MTKACEKRVKKDPCNSIRDIIVCIGLLPPPPASLKNTTPMVSSMISPPHLCPIPPTWTSYHQHPQAPFHFPFSSLTIPTQMHLQEFQLQIKQPERLFIAQLCLRATPHIYFPYLVPELYKKIKNFNSFLPELNSI